MAATRRRQKKERKTFVHSFRQAIDASISKVDAGRNVTSKNYCISSQENFPSVSEAKFDSCTDQSQMDDMKNCRRQNVVDFQSGDGGGGVKKAANSLRLNAAWSALRSRNTRST